MRPLLEFLLFLLSATASLQAQSLLTGRVVDEHETPVGQARIVVRATGGGEEVYLSPSDATGAFSLTLPHPGDYLVSVQREGYYELRDRPVHMETSAELILALTPIREVFQSINVAEIPSPIDPAQSARERTLTGTEVNDLPFSGSHSLRNAMRMIPGVIQDQTGALHFEGAAENQVLYTLNGFNIVDPVTGRFNTRLAVEGIRSLDFSSGRFSPEFGKGSAGVLAIHTDTGTDEFHYTATNFVPGVDTQNGLHLGNWRPRAGISGPLLRGRAWFANNFDAEYNQTIVNGLPAGQNQQNALAAGNLLHTQVNLTPSNILSADFLVNWEVENRAGLGPLDPLSTTTTKRARQYFASVKDQMYFTRGLLVELGYAHNRYFNRQIPRGYEVYVISPNGRSGNHFVDSSQNSSRDQFVADVYLPALHFLGTHQVKIGSDVDRLHYSASFRRSAFEQIGLTGQVLSKTTFQGSGVFHRPSAEISSYILDTWRLHSNLHAALGLRQDWDELVRQVALSPRVSLVYSPRASGKTRLVGGYALTYDATDLALFAQPLDQQAVTVLYNPDGTVAGPPAVTKFVIDRPRLRAPRSINWSASIDRELPHRIYVSGNYLWRRSGNGFTYIGGADGALHLGNSRRDQYRSASIVARQTLVQQYEWMVSYTRSQAVSNAVLNLRVDQTTQVVNNLGPMPWDAPNRFLASAYLPVPRFKNWAMAILVDARSGFPFSLVDQAGNVVGAVDSQRYPANFDLNLHLERQFVLRGYRFALRGGFNNITDHANPTAVNNVVGAPQFLQFLGTEGRHFVLRIRFFGRGGP